MLDRVKKYIQDNQLLPSHAKVIVGLSGGADSVALIYILRALGYACEAAHCNFHLRGEESVRDEHFAQQLCNQWNIPFHKIDFNTQEYASSHKLSIEMAARALRYDWFEQLRNTLPADAIAVAHHQSDQAETLLLNLKRGAGLKGLGGMRPKNGFVVRPLLCVTRREIEQFCQNEQLTYIVDSTNADTTIQRNAIREWLNQSEESDIRHMAETAQRMQAYRTLLDALFMGTPIPQETDETLLYELLAPYGFNGSQVTDILNALPSSGKRFETEHFVATIDHGKLTVSSVGIAGEDKMPAYQQTIRKRKAQESFPTSQEWRALFDADKLPKQLSLRHWKEGDFFYPISSGHAGKKKLQDFFSNQKLSLQEKEQIWLLAENDTIVWVIGYRIDNRFKITEATTQVAEINIIKGK